MQTAYVDIHWFNGRKVMEADCWVLSPVGWLSSVL